MCFRSTGRSHPPRRSLLRIRVCQRKEVTFKDPSGIVSTGLRLQPTATFNVSAGARLVVQPGVFHVTVVPANKDPPRSSRPKERNFRSGSSAEL